MALCANGYRVVLLAPEGEERKSLEALGATFIPLAHLNRRGMNPLREVALLREIVTIYRRENVICALHFTIKPVIYGSLAARWAGVANLSTLTGLGYTFLAGKKTNFIVRRLYRLALARANRVFFHNPDDQELFVSLRLCRRSQTAVVGGSGINLEAFPISPLSSAERGRMLFAGRLLSDKGLREYVDAARAARSIEPSLRFHVLGEVDTGNPASITVDELERWVAAGDIVYDGTTDNIYPHLQRAACVVLPSYREGCPRVLLEAAAVGRPLIGTDVPGVREVVLNNHNGLLVPVKNSSSLEEAMLSIFRQTPEAAEAMAQSGRKLVEERFSETAVVGAYLSGVAALLEK